MIPTQLSDDHTDTQSVSMNKSMHKLACTTVHVLTHTDIHAHIITLLGYTGNRFSTWTEPSVTGRPHAAVKANSREHHSLKMLPTPELLTSLQSHSRGSFNTTEHV